MEDLWECIQALSRNGWRVKSGMHKSLNFRTDNYLQAVVYRISYPLHLLINPVTW
jgi:hypothetical protein